jgi:hypothetical protein
MSYFDPNTKSYKTLETKAFTVQVNKGSGDSTTIVASNLSKEDIELLGSDIRFIETNTKLKKKDQFLFGEAWYFVIYGVAVLLLIMVLIVRREQIRRTADKVRYRNRHASKMAHRRLKKASKLLKANDKTTYFDELERALWGYLSDKLNIPQSNLSRDGATELLTKKGVDSEHIDEFMSLIDACQFARYAPGGMESEMSDAYQRAIKILGKIDQSV